jgi:hypothetical protein
VIGKKFKPTCSCRFSPDNREFHVLDFDSNEEEVDFANDDVFQVVSGKKRVMTN